MLRSRRWWLENENRAARWAVGRMRADLKAEFKRLLRSSIALAPGLIVPGIVNVAMYPLLTRAMSADDVGTYALVAGLVAFSPIAASLWLESAIVRYGFSGGPGLGNRDIARGRTLSLCAAAAITLLGTLLVTHGNGGLSVAASFMAIIVVRFTISLAPLRATGRFARYSLLTSVRSLLGLPLALLGGMTLGPLGAVVGQNVAQLGLAAPQRESVAAAERGGISLRQAFMYGAPIAAINVAATALSIADRYIIQLSRPLAEVAVYAAVYVILEQMFRLLPAIASTALAPSVYRLWSNGYRSRATSMILSALAIVVALDILLLAAVMAAGDIWVPLLGTAYGAANRIAAPLGIGLVLHSANLLVGLLYTAQERVRILAVNFGIAAAVNVGMNLVVVPRFGIEGAAWVTCLTYGLLLVMNVAGQTFAGPRPRSAAE